MANIYYVDSVAGSNANSGTAQGAAFRTLQAVEQIRLQPGDTVLLARGSTFHEQLDIRDSGTAGAPITFGAYGTGSDPVITGATGGINSSWTHHVVIENLTITETSNTSIYAKSTGNWTIDNVKVIDTAGGPVTAGMVFVGGSNLTIRNSTITGATRDGIWVDSVAGVTIDGNTIGTVYGSTADNLQILNSSTVVVRDNVLDLSRPTDSTKGNLVINKSVGVVIEGNTMTGGGYGASINSNHVVITGNEIANHSSYSWSYGIGLGEAWNVSDYTISDNYIHDVRFGVALTGSGSTVVARTDVDIFDNLFASILGAALKVDRPSSGTFSDNFVQVGSVPAQVSLLIAALGKFVVGQNHTFADIDPVASADAAALAEGETLAAGNVLVNDSGPSDAALQMTEINGTDVGTGVSIAGAYGTLTVAANGSYVYVLDASRLAGVSGPVTETFIYAMSDGWHTDQSDLTISIAPRANLAPVTGLDYATPTSRLASGNLLNNDTDADGDLLHLARAGGTDIPAGGLTLAGRYGVLTVAQDGSYSYVVDAMKTAGLIADTRDSFSYLASDGRAATEGLLAVTIAAPKAAVQVKPVAVDDAIRIDTANGTTARGNVLANDYDLNRDFIQLRAIGSLKVANTEVVLAGKYGDLHFNKDGSFHYDVNQARTAGMGGVAWESFSYKISDGVLTDTGMLSFTVDLHHAALSNDPFAFM